MSQTVGPEARRLFEAILQQQEAKGLEKYGRALSTDNGRDALLDAMQEAVDLWQYLAQLRLERQGSVVLTRDEAEMLYALFLMLGGGERDGAGLAGLKPIWDKVKPQEPQP